MSERPSSPHPSTTEQILDLLLDALLERQAARQGPAQPAVQEPAAEVERPAPQPAAPAGDLGPGEEKPDFPARIEPGQATPRAEPEAWEAHRESLPAQEEAEQSWAPPPLPSINLGPALGRLSLVLTVLVVLVNIPLNLQGVSLARMVPDSASLVIRDGLVLKGSGPDIYVLQDDKLRWISSLEAFQYFGYKWDEVHIVEDSFLGQFEKGRPLHVLLKCPTSPHIYALESGRKRWIKDIPTFLAEGYVWEDVKIVDCYYLRQLPNGSSIPEDAGPAPEP